MEREQVGDRALPDDHDQRVADGFGFRASLLLHLGTRFLCGKTRSERESWCDLRGFLSRTTSRDTNHAATVSDAMPGRSCGQSISFELAYVSRGSNGRRS